ncbi:tyrosine-protein kinase family protein [Methylomonas sp. HW2-6]|uniref:tyrosine-protein kinase family protein n=1 Tax=Methylomonas sp. HW2-6 TaxID=3376687 RepID=UPI004042B30A
MNRTRFICFYSYKGGTGRSLTLANIAYLMAFNGRRVLIMDMDMEAPGQHKSELFNEGLSTIDEDKPGFLEMLCERKKVLDKDGVFFIELERYIRRSSVFDRDISAHADGEQAFIRGNGSIDLLPVSQAINNDFQSQLADWNWEQFYTQYNGEDFLQYLKDEIREAGYDYVLIDSRTGMSEVFFVSTFSLADSVVLVSSLNRQNIEGSKLAAKTLLNQRLIEQYGKKNIYVVFSPVPEDASSEIETRLNEIYFEWPELEGIDAYVPYRHKLALTEKILVRENKNYLNSDRYMDSYTSAINAIYNKLSNSEEHFSVKREVEVINSINPTSINPFPAIRIEYWEPKSVVNYFVDPGNNISHAMQQFMPTVLFGSRGTGKTMLARWFSFETLAYQLKQKNKSSIIELYNKPIGLWFRLDVDLLNTFNTKDQGLIDTFNDLFGQFFDLLVLRKALDALETLGGVESWCDVKKLFTVLSREMAIETPAQNYAEMLELIESSLSDMRRYINNPARAPQPFLLQDNILIKLLAEELKRNNNFKGCYFTVFIDEYENFHAYQQRVINTRVKQVKESDRVTYKLLARNDGFRTYETRATGQSIEDTHDYRAYYMDEGLVFNVFKEHVEKIVCRHLQDSDYFKVRGCLNTESLFTQLSAEDEAILIADKRGNTPLKKWLVKQYGLQVSQPLVDWMDDESNLLRQAVAVVLLNQGKSIEQIISAFNTNNETAKDWYHNYHRGALYWLCSLYKKSKTYAGFEQIVGVAGNNTRVALDLCYAIIEEWRANDHKLSLPISIEIQSAAIHKQSDTYLRGLRDRRNGQDFYRFVERLGRLFEIIHKGPRQGEPEINHFSINGDISKELDDFIKNCRIEAILRWLPGNKQKSKSDQQKDAWQLHPRYTPKFDISWRRKKMLKLTANELQDIVFGDDDAWKKIVNLVEQKYCHIKNITSTNQTSLLDEDHSEF